MCLTVQTEHRLFKITFQMVGLPGHEIITTVYVIHILINLPRCYSIEISTKIKEHDQQIYLKRSILYCKKNCDVCLRKAFYGMLCPYFVEPVSKDQQPSQHCFLKVLDKGMQIFSIYSNACFFQDFQTSFGTVDSSKI